MTIELNNGLIAPSDAAGEWEQVAWRIGVEVAAKAADDVDRNARFPAEAVEAIRSAKLLSALLPKELGGGGASLVDIVAAVRALATHCASSALVLAMHSIEVYNIARHGDTDALRTLARDISAEGCFSRTRTARWASVATSAGACAGSTPRARRGRSRSRRSQSPTARTPT